MPTESTLWLVRMTKYIARRGPRPSALRVAMEKSGTRDTDEKRHDDANADTWQYR